MKVIKEPRQKRSSDAFKSTSPLPIVLAAIVAFVIGMMGAVGMVQAPKLFPRHSEPVNASRLDVKSADRPASQPPSCETAARCDKAN
ncbi:hypothetical protein [Pseudorhodoplanes sp.]|uniref:hypothetical protein n=1 Tax=Pseudorhodoplanes sp. TaxID=1934341 RepID=UPI0039198B47